jgi:hypothetical protein
MIQIFQYGGNNLVQLIIHSTIFRDPSAKDYESWDLRNVKMRLRTEWRMVVIDDIYGQLLETVRSTDAVEMRWRETEAASEQ